MDKEEYNQIVNSLNYLNAVSCFREMNSYLNILETQIYRRSYLQDKFKLYKV